MIVRPLLTIVAMTAIVAVAPVASTASSAAPRAATPDTFVSQWDAVGSAAFTAAALTPAEGHTIFAYEAIAVYDAVAAVQHRFRPFAVHAHAPAGASPEAAVAAAAHRVLVHYLPAQAPTVLDPALASSLAAIPDGQPKTTGIAVGEQVADALLALRQDDGFRAPVVYTPPDPPIPGVWLPTATTPAVGTYLGGMRPFALRSADQFRPAGPPPLRSKRWAREYNEVKDIGSASSTVRTAEQTLAARFWAEPPVQQAHGSFRRFVADRSLDVGQAARFMAMVAVSYADAQIVCYKAKYRFAFWRPITAIRAGDTDGNKATVADPTWTHLLPATPNHPDYPSAHSCVTPTAGIVISRLLGTSAIDFTIPSLTGLGDRHYASARALTDEVSNARIWGGIHFRSAVEDGVLIAQQTANYVLAHNFKRSVHHRR
jgi:hypothetical protein